MLRRVLLVLVIVGAACGDTTSTQVTAPPAPAATTTEAATSTSAASTTTAPATTTAPMTTITTTTVPPTTTTVAGPSAADDLTAFFAAAEALDAEISAAAGVYNAGFDEAAGTVSAAAIDAITALDAGSVAPLIPAGLDLDLETAVLAVYADLESRAAALDGGVRYLNQGEFSDTEFTLYCLGLGSDSNARFDGDLAAAMALAASSPQPTAAPDSDAAGILAVRVEAIRSMNWGCDSCGGVVITEPIGVDWGAKTVFGSVEFEATFNGTSWEILIYAC